MDAIILFVEDNRDLRKNAALVLELEGYHVHVASDGREALELLEGGLIPDLIVSDIMMPRMDGYEFFEAVRRLPHLTAVPFIFLTARGSRRDISTGRQMGVDDYLVKPFEPEDFLIAVQNKLQRTAAIRAQAVATLDDARRMLIQMLSHELRTPLTYVTGGFALLAEELETQQAFGPGDDVSVSLDLIQSGTLRLNRLAEQMVLYSQVISGYVAQQVSEMSERHELEFVVSDALELLGKLAHSRQVMVRSTCEAGDPPIVISGVKDLLVTALAEVIRNAIQYSAEGDAVEVSCGMVEGQASVSVIDHGLGINEHDQAAIWNVLIQSERDRNEQQGIGMGLPIARGIVEAHGGTIALHSVAGEGTQVTIRLPAAPAP